MREQWGREELFGCSVRGVTTYRARKLAWGTGRRGLKHQDKTLMVLILELYRLLGCPFLDWALHAYDLLIYVFSASGYKVV